MWLCITELWEGIPRDMEQPLVFLLLQFQDSADAMVEMINKSSFLSRLINAKLWCCLYNDPLFYCEMKYNIKNKESPLNTQCYSYLILFHTLQYLMVWTM